MSVTYTAPDRDDLEPVYCKYQGQLAPQPARILLTEDGEVYADYNGEINGTPMFEWLGRTKAWTIPAEATGEAIADLFEDETFCTLIERVHAGHTVEWDGNNHRGRLTDDAREADEALSEYIDNYFSDGSGCATHWDTSDYLFMSCKLSDHWRDQELYVAVQEIEDMAKTDGVILDGDIEDCLLDHAQSYFERGSPFITKVIADELLSRKRIDQDQYDEWIEENK